MEYWGHLGVGLDKFISISVGQGDAFYLERDGKKILIDGGRSKNGFANQFMRTVGSQSVDVLVCTHADADHINGLLGFFEAGFTAHEVWLPGSWTSRLTDLLLNPKDFISEVFEQASSYEHTNANNLECIYKNLIKRTHKGDNRETKKTKKDIKEEVILETQPSKTINSLKISAAIQNAPSSSLFDDYLKNKKSIKNLLFYGPECNFNLFIDAISTAKRVRDLAILAYRSGAKIRWFEFNNKQESTGGESYLKPANSREIFFISSKIYALNYLSLTKANRESLVFYSPSSDHLCDVLFCADSDLSFKYTQLGIGSRSIITTPHHGSEHNKQAYTQLKKHNLMTKKTIFVRSDGRFKSRPGISYKSLTAKKACTLCNIQDAERQNIVFISSKSGWRRGNGVTWCNCI